MNTPSALWSSVNLPSGWRLQVAADYEAGSALAAEVLREALARKPDLLLCAATGSSPARTYELFVRSVLRAGQPSASKLRILKLDEWSGISADDEGSCESHLQRLLIRPLAISPDRYTGFGCDAPSPGGECQRVSSWLAENGPVDLCLLGLGLNGHLGFIEPSDELSPRCHVAVLSETTLSHPMIARSSFSPTHGLSLGARDILDSTSILLLVFGSAKAQQLLRLLTGCVTPKFPASILTNHPNVICICDEEAAQLLPEELKAAATAQPRPTDLDLDPNSP